MAKIANRGSSRSMLVKKQAELWNELMKEQGAIYMSYNDIWKAAKDQGRDDAWVDKENDKLRKINEVVRPVYSEQRQSLEEAASQDSLARNNTLDSISLVYQRADRILTGLDIEVRLSDEDTDTPAWNDGKVVTFNSSRVRALTAETVCSLHGLNYHELGHLLFSPRAGSDLGKWLIENPHYHSAYNILEDAREEKLLIIKHPSVKDFLVSTIGEYLLAEDSDPDNYVLLAGRHYLPTSVRAASLRRFIDKFDEDKARRVHNIVNEYRDLAFPRDYDKAKELIILLYDEDVYPNSPNGCTNRGVMKNGRPTSGKEQESMQQRGEASTSFDELAESTGDMSGQGQNDNEVEQPSKADNASGGDEDTARDDMADIISKMVEEARSTKNVTDQVRETTKAINKATGTKTLLTKQSGTPNAPHHADVIASRTFAEELERLRIDADNEWRREKPTGKLNVRRAMQADVNDINKLFDRWELGSDDHLIEAAILIDRSGSMALDIGKACRAAWVIKRGVERINGRVTTMTFSDVSKLLQSAEEKASGSSVLTVPAGGGTDPTFALKETERIMMQSDRPTKLVFILTDGQFYSAESDNLIARMNAAGVHTSLVYLSSYVLEEADLRYTHGVKTFRQITKANELIGVAKDIVRAYLRRK